MTAAQLLGALGDIHGDLERAYRIMTRHPEVPAWLCVGDLGDASIATRPPPAPLSHVKGNNEDFEFLARLARGEVHVPNLHYLANACPAEVAGARVVALGGTYAPTWYDTPSSALPYPGMPLTRALTKRPVRDDKRRHFVREEVEACKRMRDIEVFVSHEAPRPFLVTPGEGQPGRRPSRPLDAGKTPINEILAAMKPRLHLFGHHHRFTEALRQGVRSIGLDLVSRSYLILDTGAWTYEKHDVQ